MAKTIACYAITSNPPGSGIKRPVEPKLSKINKFAATIKGERRPSERPAPDPLSGVMRHLPK